jgi:AraC-like DNA-binding protein
MAAILPLADIPLLSAAIDLIRAMLRNAAMQKTEPSATSPLRSARVTRLAVRPDASGIATRLALQRLRHAHIAVGPLLKSAGLSAADLNNPDSRVSVASQIAFLDLAARTLNKPFLGFRLAQDFDLRQMGLLHYVLASSETLGDAFERAERFSSIANAGLVLRCSGTGDWRITLQYAGVSRHSDCQQIESLVTMLVRMCRVLTGQRLAPLAVRFVHRRSDDPSELQQYFGCGIDFGADTDAIIFEGKVRQLRLVGADPYLNKILLRDCQEALSQRRSAESPLRITVENAIVPLLPHGKARLDTVARKLGMSSRTLARRLTAEGLNFAEIYEKLRSDLAVRYLSEASLSISQIAWLVGFRGVSAFTHACKRWTGKTPTALRRQRPRLRDQWQRVA